MFLGFGGLAGVAGFGVFGGDAQAGHWGFGVDHQLSLLVGCAERRLWFGHFIELSLATSRSHHMRCLRRCRSDNPLPHACFHSHPFPTLQQRLVSLITLSTLTFPLHLSNFSLTYFPFLNALLRIQSILIHLRIILIQKALHSRQLINRALLCQVTKLCVDSRVDNFRLIDELAHHVND